MENRRSKNDKVSRIMWRSKQRKLRWKNGKKKKEKQEKRKEETRKEENNGNKKIVEEWEIWDEEKKAKKMDCKKQLSFVFDFEHCRKY